MSDSFSDSSSEERGANETEEIEIERKEEFVDQDEQAGFIEIELIFKDDEPAKNYKEHIFIIEENSNFEIITLSHPKTETKVKFAINIELKKLYEIQRFKRIPSSFFIDEEVKEGIFNMINMIIVRFPLIHHSSRRLRRASLK
jgi:hypothetical protein